MQISTLPSFSVFPPASRNWTWSATHGAIYMKWVTYQVVRLSGVKTQIVYAWRAWYPFSCDHDQIEIGAEFLGQKSNVLCVITNFAFNAWCVWYLLPNSLICVVSCLIPLLFFLFWVFGYAHAQLRCLYPLSTLDAAHMRKYTRISPLAQLQCLRSRVEEPLTRLQWLQNELP